MRIYTRTGDDGTTGLLYGGRAGKDDLRIEAVGTVDEAVAALGLARAAAAATGELILRLQRELFVAGAELATSPENASKLKPGHTSVTPEMVDALEALIDETEAKAPMPKEFVIPGGSPAGAALDLARAVVRRAERRAVGLGFQGTDVQRYLNRLADLLFVLARFEDGGFTPVRG